MKKILVLNLNRMGDLIQGFPLIQGLKRMYPSSQLTLMAWKGFWEVCTWIKDIDELFVFEPFTYLIFNEKDDIEVVKSYKGLKRFINDIKARHFDMIINLTYSKFSAALTMALSNSETEIRGFSADEEGFRSFIHPWTTYFFSVVMNREINQFNLVDINLRIGDVDPGKASLSIPPHPDDETTAEEFFRNNNINRSIGPIICVQPGASDYRKRWPVENFIRLSDMLIGELGAQVIFLGSEEESKIWEELKKGMKYGAINGFGTSLMQLRTLLRECDCLVTNDTGPMHIATAVGCRVIELSMGGVYFPETGPYGEGHIVIQSNMPCAPCSEGISSKCNNPVCQQYITPEIVFKVVQSIFMGSNSNHSDEKGFNGCSIYLSKFDEDGMLEFTPEYPYKLNERMAWGIIYREFWKVALDSKDEGAALNAIIERFKGYLMEGDPKDIERVVEEMDKKAVLKRLNELGENAIGILSALKMETEMMGEGRGGIMSFVSMLKEIHEEINNHGISQKVVSPIIHQFNFMNENLKEKDPKNLTNDLYKLYNDFTDWTRLLLSFLDEVISYLKKFNVQGSKPAPDRLRSSKFKKLTVY